MRRGGLFGLAMICGACSSNDTAAQPDTANDGGAEEAESERLPPPIDPSLFDCTSLAKPPLPRRSATSAECLREPRCSGRFVVGHRGAGGDLGRVAPEDTLSAYRAAIAMGVDFVETDPRPTADGVIVNIHDGTVDRTTNGTGAVDEMTYEELQKLTVKSDRFTGDFSCDRVPTLEDVLLTARGRAIVMIDANKSDRVEAMVDLVKKTDTLEWAVFDTDDLDKIDRALAIEPRLMIQPRAKKIEDVAPILARYASHLPVFVELGQSLFPRGVAEVRAAGTRVFTDVFVADIGVRTGGDRKVYLDFFASGADALQTDLPDEILRSIGRPVPPP
ncbi:MAG: glycerophosphodiester phosphodiesterase family protein [Labilithrix sp.]|nr:glycerophosphodiester phosphodiesterase family protein [Labilithrix sp.]